MKRHCFWRSLLLLCCFFLPALASAAPLELKTSVSDDPVVPGQGFFYRIMATNTNPEGGAPLENVTITLIVPDYTVARWYGDFVTGAGVSTSHREPGELLTLTVSTLAPGESREVQIPMVVTADIALSSLPQTLAARFEGTYTGGGQALADEEISIVAVKPLDIQLSATPSPLTPSGELTYTLTFGNAGTQAVSNADLTLQLPSGVTVLDSSGGNQVGNSIVWSIAQLNSGTSDRRQVKVKDTLGGISRVLQAQAEIDDQSGAGPDARASLLTPIRANLPLHLTLAISDDPVRRSQQYFYRLTATNTNPVSGAPLENVVVRLIVPDYTVARWYGDFVTGADVSTSHREPGELLTLTVGTLAPGESREVKIPMELRDDVTSGTLFDARFFGYASFPDGTVAPQVTSTVTALIGEYAVAVPTYDLTVTKIGTGEGTVSSNPAGINCGSDCTENYPEGTSVTLTATPDSSFVFAGWSGACSGSGTCVVTMDAAKNVTATFALENSDPATTLITHYYVSILEREPEEEGLAFWKDQIAEKQAKDEDVKPVFRAMAAFFFFSEEYIGRNTTNIQFLTNLYLTFFQREPDDEGLEFWLVKLVGGMSRNQAMQGFLFSPEFTSFMEDLGF